NDSPVLLDHIMNCAIQMQVEAVCHRTHVVIAAIKQHIQQAGQNSRDSATSQPPNTHPTHKQDEMREQHKNMPLQLPEVALMN
ncbi:hypothetical protein, partial [Pseudomonas syringae group genomosp. 7]|uniref:hypothetical protein n=1 Tax=Pseudomonas syringae group genomosp. 7 TaxID=251699 RepID=UPI00376FD706